MRLHRHAIAALGFALVAGSALPAAAQNPDLTGTFALVEAESDDVKAAIEQAVRGMNFITRPIARGRLTRTNVPYRTIRIEQSGDQVTIVTDERPIVATADGNPMKWTREDGEVLDLTTRWADGALEQTFVADDGQRTNTFTLSADGGTLEMRVVVASPRLDRPVEYTLRYRRQ
ncbi:MAG TPA: hypothetical protein VF167_15680 [Longimicrobiaceae bacterium]